MQKLMREYLNELKNRKKRRRRTQIAVVILVSIVVGSVIGALAQYGVAMTGGAKCGKEEHTHDLDCYEKTLVCTQPESDGHHHTDACYRTETHLVCGLEESEEHTHSDDCYETTESLICGEEEYEGHQHTDACYEDQLVCGKEVHTHSEECYIDTEADVEDANLWNKQYEELKWKDTWSENLVMAAREQIGYKESADNYTIAEDGSHKGYTRYGQFAVDTGVEGADVYADWDTAFVNFCLFYSGISATNIFPTKMDTVEWYEEFRKINENIDEYLSCLAAPEGYTPKTGDIVIFQKGKEEEEREYQMGIVSSYDKEKDELKVIEGNSKNEVKENDYYIEAKGDQDDGMAPVFCYVDMSGIEKAYKGTDEAEEDPVEPGEPVEPEKPKDDKTETEEPKDTADTEDPDGKTDEEENPEEETIELTTEVDGTTITLSGPASSFEEGKKYEIQAEKVEDEETIATIEEAIDKEAEKQEKKVENYQAFDIKLMLDDEEVQPLGPVEVKFSGKEVKKSVENEETEVSVLHVDENTGEATDMEATATEEKEVVIETKHFSLYVYVDLTKTDITGKIQVKVEHWGKNITTVKGEAKAAGSKNDEEAIADQVYLTEGQEKGKGKVQTDSKNREIYRTDDFEIPSEYYDDIEKLSKLCLAGKENINYNLSEIWIASDGVVQDMPGEGNEGKWTGEYVKYVFDESSGKLNEKYSVKDGKETKLEITDKEADDSKKDEVKIEENSTFRFWYTPKKANDDANITDANFYDYDISDGKRYEKKDKCNKDHLKTAQKGVNSSGNYTSGDTRPKLSIGQYYSGNMSPEAWKKGGTGHYTGDVFYDKYGETKEINGGNGKTSSEIPIVLKGIVDDILTDEDGKPDPEGNVKFNVSAPNNLFTAEGTGVTEYNYRLGFQQDGDTFTLQSVSDKEGNKVLSDLTKVTWDAGAAYSNRFWPLDSVAGGNHDPLMGNGNYALLDSGGNCQGTGPIPPNDDGGLHNWHFGMTYAIKFKVGDYTGPMEFYFRGDDDFWLFIDGKKAIDIGGIHSAVGEKIDLRQWMIENGLLDSNGKEIEKDHEYTMKIFYMERGGSGSCCYMQYTLPNSSPVDIPDMPTTTYKVTKAWDDGDNKNPFRPKEIKVVLLKDDEETNSVVSLTEENNWTHEWSNLPAQIKGSGDSIEYKYKIKEIDLPPGYSCYKVDSDGNEILDSDGNKILDIENMVEEDSDGNKNIIGVLKNHLNYVSVDVSKVWINDEDLIDDYRPDSVKVRLYATDSNGNEIPYKDKDGVRELSLSASKNWKGTFEKLPEFCDYEWYKDDGDDSWKCRAHKIKYSVKEIDENGNVISETMEGKKSSKYSVTYSDPVEIDENTGKASLEVTNTLLTKFRIIKKGSESNLSNAPKLEGAVFSLIPTDAPMALTKYIGKSDEQGIIQWSNVDGGEIVTMLEKGEYLMKETKAPIGYSLSNIEWIVTVKDLGRATIVVKGIENEPLSPSNKIIGTGTEQGEVIFEYDFYDEALYELPSTGGSGTYGYMFSGVLLLAVTALMTYRNKRKEVLRS